MSQFLLRKENEMEEFIRLINGSKQYEFDGTELEIIGYYSGQRIKLDLGRMTEEILKELIVDEEED